MVNTCFLFQLHIQAIGHILIAILIFCLPRKHFSAPGIGQVDFCRPAKTNSNLKKVLFCIVGKDAWGNMDNITPK